MPQEKQMREGMPIKQKLTIGAMAVVVLVIVWQVKGLFGGGGSSTHTPVPSSAPKMSATAPGGAPAMSAAAPSAGPASTTGAVNGQAAPAIPQPMQAQLPDQTAPAPVVEPEQQVNQEKYLSKLNELEQLKVQQSIAETNQAIATAKLATVTAEKDITDLLTKPAISVTPPMPSPALPSSAYANQLNAGGTTTVTVTPPPRPVEPIVIEEPYTVVSVTMQLGHWSAVMGNQGKIYNVSVGDALPPDNSIVVRINRNGVTLRKNNKTRKISLTSSI